MLSHKSQNVAKTIGGYLRLKQSHSVAIIDILNEFDKANSGTNYAAEVANRNKKGDT